ncbi:hypothetical protein [Rhodanobacter sp. MP1X3]|uniref:hypothetical protein n=1 Tax=Rhodanobacter sp. MP1X3 TaxID=2723086 RepID=UPI001610C7F5|nr:hypothetical protein [Rhodanobacter sp. MP1X3]MBB6242972.1 hypothetical protein [Rhodanobacter sp. MP1X3]
MRIFLLSCVLFAVLAGSAASAQPLQPLASLNHSPVWDGVSSEENNAELIAQFRGKPFVCRKAKDHTPEDSANASRAFDDLVKYVDQGERIENFWNDSAHKQRREDLLAAAIKAGSWKATYLDSVWSIRYPKDGKAQGVASVQLERLVRQGIPLAAYKYATYLYGRDDKAMYQLLADAIERGSPEAMELVGGTIVIQSKALRPAGKAMLDCALSQGYAAAYNDLGVLADMEGHRLDAYRLWEKGVNSGCEECAHALEGFAKIRKGYTPASSMGELVPELARIEKFYSDNFLYELSGLPDLYLPLPDELAFHTSDADLFKLLELEQFVRAHTSDGP